MQALTQIWIFFMFYIFFLNNLSEKENNDNENLPNCTYRDVSYFSNLDVELKSKCLSSSHLNINSLSKIFDNFNHLNNELEFDVLGILRILKSQSLKVVSATFLLVCFVCLRESTCETRKNAFYFTSKALLVLEIINF